MKEAARRQQSFDRSKKPPRQNLFFLPFIWIFCFFITKIHGLKIKKVNMEGLKPPYLVLSTHHGFVDFYVAPIVLFPHRANYISELEGFIGREWLYRQIGCICKRKFTTDLALIRNIQYVVSKSKDIMLFYPEARYCNVGTNSKLPEAVGKLAKVLHVPVVILNMRGNYLLSPIWNLTKRKGVHLEADLTQVLTAEQTQTLSIEEINQTIAKHFIYDDYQWQKENKIKISYEKRAEGLHKVLYLCPHCKSEYQMNTKGSILFCENCKKQWYMTEYGELNALEGKTEFSHIPDWYEYQRQEVKKEIAQNCYVSSAPVKVEALPNAKGFIDWGKGFVKHDGNGYVLEFKEYGQQRKFEFPPIEMTSVHTEYDYRGKGECITLSTLDNTYFLYPLIKEFNVTKVQFATEELYEIAYQKKKRKTKKAL